MWAAGQFDLLAFQDRDDLIAAVIETQFNRWLTAWEMPPGTTTGSGSPPGQQCRQGHARLPEFIRLGLMLSLERRPVERARAMYLEREHAPHEIASTIRGLRRSSTSRRCVC